MKKRQLDKEMCPMDPLGITRSKECLQLSSFSIGFFIHHDINVDALFFRDEGEMIDMDYLFLSHADRSGHGLVHERRGPVGTHKDDAVVFLEVQPNAARLEL